MVEFRRGLSKAFVQALNHEYDRGGWWRRLISDPDLYLGIREESLNLYYRGNSLLKLTFKHEKLRAEVHYKYLLDPDAKPTLIAFQDGERVDKLGEERFLLKLDPDLLKRASAPYAGEEKKGVHEILRRNRNIVDVEIALAGERREATRRSAKRIDFAALQPKDGGMELVFFEAKHFSNVELRAKDDAIPPAELQIRGYEQLISQHGGEIERAYRRVCANLGQLKGVRGRLRCLAEKVCEGTSFTVNPLPRLVVFGFDDDQRIGEYWGRHMMKLMALGEDRILTRGNPKGFCKGISSGI